MTRRRSIEPVIQAKQFESIEEIDRGISRLNRRIEEVRALDPKQIRWDSQFVQNARDNIRKDILTIFGENSPEHRDHQYLEIVGRVNHVSPEEWEHEENFVKGIPESVTLIQGLIKRLEEERELFLPPKPQHSAESASFRQRAPTIHIQGGVKSLALGDINEQHVSVIAILDAVSNAVTDSSEIPPDEKSSILAKLRELSKNPWILALGSGTLMEFLKRAITGG